MYQEENQAEKLSDKIKQLERNDIIHGGVWGGWGDNMKTTDFSLEIKEARNSGKMSLKYQRGGGKKTVNTELWIQQKYSSRRKIKPFLYKRKL